MQILTGHGIFKVYRRTISKEVHSRCWDFDTEGDDTEHALFHSPRWIYDRTELETYVGILLTTENVIDVVINKKDN